MTKIGFIDYYLDEWHANAYPAMIHEASNGEMEVAYAYGQIPSPITGMTTPQWCEKHGIAQCDTIEEIIEKSDCIVVLSPDNCEMHEQLCQLPLASGKPTYVDKTFSPDLASGKRIFAVAEANHTPCYSTSALRFATEYANVDRQQIVAINSWGPGGFDTYSIHQLEPMLMLMGVQAQKVMYRETEKWCQLIINFVDGRCGTMSNYRNGSPFMMNIAGTEKNELIKVESEFFKYFIEELVKFFRTGVPEVPHEVTLQIMSVREAGLKARQCPGQWVDVEAV